MGANTISDFADTGAAARFFAPCTGFIDIRWSFANVVVFKRAIKFFIRKGVAHTYIHFMSLLARYPNIIYNEQYDAIANYSQVKM